MPGFTVGAIIAGLVLSGIGVEEQVRGARKAGKAAKSAADADADLNDYNAEIAELQAIDAVERGEVEAARYGAQVRGLIGSQRTGFAAQGVDVASGSAADVQADTAAIGEMDALQIKSNAKRQAWGYEVQAYDSRMRAYYERQEGVMLQSTGNVQATAALLQGAGGILSTGLNYTAMRYGFREPSYTYMNAAGIPSTTGTAGGGIGPAPKGTR